MKKEKLLLYLINYNEQYVRCDIETDPAILETVLLDIWSIPQPALLMQVTGGHKYFKLRGKMEIDFLGDFLNFVSESSKNIFFNNIFECFITNSDTWLLTNGINAGIVKLIGQAIHKRKMTKPDDNTVAIGVCNYRCVKNIKDFQRLRQNDFINQFPYENHNFVSRTMRFLTD